jgi:hypothetical protein
MTGMSQGHVTNVLRRRRPLSLDRADDILSHLNADVRDFIKTEELLDAPALTPWCFASEGV